MPWSDKWFMEGMNVAVLAPIGLSNQNFIIEANENIVSIPTKVNSSMPQIDTG